MIESKIRKWGNSYGVLISKKEIKKHHLSKDALVVINIKKKQNLEKLFWICKFSKPTKEIIEEIKQGYDGGILL